MRLRIPWPSSPKLCALRVTKRSRPISTAHALASARTHLQEVLIGGHGVLETYGERRPDGTSDRHLYRIFPDAWTDGPENAPATFDVEALTPVVSDEAAGARLAQGPELAVVTLGKRGCQVWAANERFHALGFLVQDVDTTGVDDAFHGAFLYVLLQGWDLRKTAGFASPVAAISCRTLGGRRGLPTRTKVEVFLNTAQPNAGSET